MPTMVSSVIPDLAGWTFAPLTWHPVPTIDAEAGDHMKIGNRTCALLSGSAAAFLFAAMTPVAAHGAVRPALTYPKSNKACVLLVVSKAYKPVPKVALAKSATYVNSQGTSCLLSKDGSDATFVPQADLVIFPSSLVASLPGSTPIAKINYVVKIGHLPVTLKAAPSMGKNVYFGRGTSHNLQIQAAVWYQNNTIAAFASEVQGSYPFLSTFKSIESHFKS